MKLYNTATRNKEDFKPLHNKEVGIYSCGPTVYWNQHIGNMYAFVNWDILVRVLRYFGYKVTWVMNITDVGHLTSDGDEGEDKMEKGSQREGLTPWELAKKYEAQFIDSLQKLNVVPPDYLPKATEHINEQIDLGKKIDKRGFAYQTQTGLVFDTSKFPDYAKFANLKLDELNMGSRVEVDVEKRNPWDFLLWITNQPNHIMKWDSPWGEGFPGWHLECTAMSTKYLGEQFDIHTGGIEHIGVHHTNEIAQAYGAFGHNTANYWLHNAWLTLKEGKMSKSLGNVYTVQQLVEMGYDPLALRYLVLSSHYRSGLVFSLDSLKAAQNALEKLRNYVSNFKNSGKKLSDEVHESYMSDFDQKIGDDLAMPEAMSVVWKMLRSNIDESVKIATLLKFDEVLGLKLNEIYESSEEVPKEIMQLAEERQRARREKNWAESDRLRELITSKGYLVEDLKESYKIKKI